MNATGFCYGKRAGTLLSVLSFQLKMSIADQMFLAVCVSRP